MLPDIFKGISHAESSSPVTDVPSATAYHNRIMTHAPDGFTPVMTLYLTDNTDQKTVLAAKQSSIIEAFKLYPAGATTNSAFGVSTIKAMYPLFEAMESHDVILSIHGEFRSRHRHF